MIDISIFVSEGRQFTLFLRMPAAETVFPWRGDIGSITLSVQREGGGLTLDLWENRSRSREMTAWLAARHLTIDGFLTSALHAFVCQVLIAGGLLTATASFSLFAAWGESVNPRLVDYYKRLGFVPAPQAGDGGGLSMAASSVAAVMDRIEAIGRRTWVAASSEEMDALARRVVTAPANKSIRGFSMVPRTAELDLALAAWEMDRAQLNRHIRAAREALVAKFGPAAIADQ